MVDLVTTAVYNILLCKQKMMLQTEELGLGDLKL